MSFDVTKIKPVKKNIIHFVIKFIMENVFDFSLRTFGSLLRGTSTESYVGRKLAMPYHLWQNILRVIPFNFCCDQIIASTSLKSSSYNLDETKSFSYGGRQKLNSGCGGIGRDSSIKRSLLEG